MHHIRVPLALLTLAQPCPAVLSHAAVPCLPAAAADLMKGGEATVGHGVYSNTAVTNVAAVSAADAVPNAWGGVSSPYGAAPMTPFSPGEGCDVVRLVGCLCAAPADKHFCS